MGSLIISIIVCLAILVALAYLASKANAFWSAMGGESTAIVKYNNIPIRPLLQSDTYTLNGWDIENANNKNYVGPRPFLGMRGVGIYPFVQLEPVTLKCNEFSPDKKSVRKCAKQIYEVVPIFHNHAYITDEVELDENFRVFMKLLFRFRIMNLYDVRYKTEDVIENLEAVGLGAIKSEAEDYDFDTLRDGKEFVGKVKTTSNLELGHYGIKTVGVHFIDMEPADQKTRDILEAAAHAKRQADVIRTLKQAEADGDKMVRQVEVDMHALEFQKFIEQLGGREKIENPADFVRAFALTKLRNLTALSMTSDGMRQTYDINK